MIDWIIAVVVLLAGGLLGAANLIVSKKPNAQELINKLVPYQGWVGVILFVWGIWWLISCFRTISTISAAPVWWLIWLVAAMCMLALGFLLGYGLLNKYVLSKSTGATEKGRLLQIKLAAFQGPLGVVAIVLAVLTLINGLRTFQGIRSLLPAMPGTARWGILAMHVQAGRRP